MPLTSCEVALMSMTPPRKTLVCRTLVAALLSVGGVGCGERVDSAGSAPANPTAGQRLDAAVDKTERAATQMRAEAERAAGTVERKIDDAAITASVMAKLAQDSELSAMKIDVTTTSGVVTLAGPASSAQSKDRATSLAQAVDGVAGVNNNLQVGPR
jgi:hyperosmotically inducible protein